MELIDVACSCEDYIWKNGLLVLWRNNGMVYWFYGEIKELSG